MPNSLHSDGGFAQVLLNRRGVSYWWMTEHVTHTFAYTHVHVRLMDVLCFSRTNPAPPTHTPLTRANGCSACCSVSSCGVEVVSKLLCETELLFFSVSCGGRSPCVRAGVPLPPSFSAFSGLTSLFQTAASSAVRLTECRK